MSAGTKLSAAEEAGFEENLSEEKRRDLDETEGANKTTKIGELSDFEKQLIEDDASKSAEAAPTEDAPAATEEAATEEVSEAPVAEAVEETTDAQSDELDFEAALEASFVDYQEGDIVQGTVRAITKGGIMVDLNYKSDAYVPLSDISFDPNEGFIKTVQIGDTISIMVEKLETKEGYILASRRKAECELAWQNILRLSREKEIITVRVQNVIPAGAVVDFKGLNGFIPSSQLLLEGAELETANGTELEVVVMQVDRRRRKIVMSHKLSKVPQFSGSIQEKLEKFQEGQTLKGVVSNIKNFGVFVDVGGIEGLVHISELSWSRINHPSEVLSVGQELEVYVIKVDLENKRLSLGYKRLQADPWDSVAEKFHEGQVLKGTVSRIVEFGAFVKLTDDLEGLVHISEISDQRILRVSDHLREGDEVDVKIIKLQIEEHRIGLSMKKVAAGEGSAE